MSAQRLGERRTRRLARDTDLEIVRAWAHGGYTYDFVIAADNTDRHAHGWFDKKTGKWGLYPIDDQSHYHTCFTELFPPPQP